MISPPRRPALRAPGFTLVELLAVLVVIGICAGLVSALAGPGARGMLRFEAERLARLLELAGSEARLTGSTVRWTCDGRRYGFTRSATDGGWSETRDGGPLRAHDLAAEVRVTRLLVEERAGAVMQLDFAPHAPSPVFRIEMTAGAERYTVSGSALGDVRAQRMHAARP